MYQCRIATRPLRRLPFAAALVGVLALSGCSLAPGGHMDYNTQAAPINDLVDVQPITPGLVASMPRAGNRATPMP
ncbi:MAG: polysaccharide export protein Wza, partial [Halomonas glaciei]